jgi:hypothetical protein
VSKNLTFEVLGPYSRVENNLPDFFFFFPKNKRKKKKKKAKTLFSFARNARVALSLRFRVVQGVISKVPLLTLCRFELLARLGLFFFFFFFFF